MEAVFEGTVVSEETLQDKIYNIRGQKVMLDFDLAQIYGYETKNFNRQIKNNAEKFVGDDFMFRLSKEEFEDLRCKNFTSSWGGTRYAPMAFTEQGIYMLMTVLRGDLAIKQSRALIRTFKRMKEAIFNTQELVDQRAYYQVMMQTSKNGSEIALLENRMVEVEKQLSDVAHRMEDTVKESDLAELMHHFAGKAEKGWVIYNTKYCSADEAYASIYGQAKRTIYVVDNYIGLRTLVLLKNAPVGVSVTLFSDNVGQQKLHHIEYNDFCLEYPHIKIQMKQTGRICHDRFIVLDYGTADARIFLCGASSKDAGARITSIVEDYGIEKYKSMIQGFLNNPPLKLV